jgi:hypothetical protein
MILSMRWIRAILIVATLCFVANPTAWAALPTNPGQPKTPSKRIVYGSYIGVAVLIIAVCTAAFKPAKRTHQD